MAGQVVYVVDGGTRCYCVCSCLAYDTPVAIPGNNWKKIQAFTATGKDEVLTFQADKSWHPRPVVFSDGVKPLEKGSRPVIHIKATTNVELWVTLDHVFLLPDNTLILAMYLLPEDAHRVDNPAIQLVDETGAPVSLAFVERGRFTGGFHNISTYPVDRPGDPIWNHLINTAGIISGDFYAQLYLAKGSLLSQPNPVDQANSVVDQHPSAVMSGPRLSPIVYGPNMNVPDSPVDNLQPTLSGAAFVPSVPRKFTPPKDAVPFLPDYMETPVPGTLAPLSDQIPLEIAQYIVNHYRRFFPEVIYEIWWEDDTVNAYAWRDPPGTGTRHVALLGGLIRHQSLHQEGVGLVLAHELGHHYGRTPPSHPSGLACEGEADWNGSNFIQRRVWFGEMYIDQTERGAEQLYNLFAHGLIKTISDDEERRRFAANSCSHPPAACRRDTYLAAVAGGLKPDCAGDP